MSASTRPDLRLPGGPGLEVRPVTLADVEEVYSLVAAAALAITGDPDTTREETLADLQDSRLDLAADTTLVLTTGNHPQAIGYALAAADEVDAYIDVYLDPALPDDAYEALGGPLLDWTLRRVRERVSAEGREPAKVFTGSYLQEARQRALLEAAGFAAERLYWRMSIELAGRPPRPPLPSSMTLRRLDLADDDDRRLAHRLHEEPFTEHHGYQPESYDHFWERHPADSPVLDPSMWWVAEVDGEPAGMLRGSETRASEGGGYVASLGVLAQHRGLGVGKQLLHESFDQYEAKGRTWVSLGVDSENATGATRLYESVGMRPTATVVQYTRQLSR